MYSYSIKVYIWFFLSDFVYNPRFDILRTYLRRRVTALLAKNLKFKFKSTYLFYDLFKKYNFLGDKNNIITL